MHFTEVHVYATPPSNNSQFDQGSRSARALISPGVFSSTGSRPWITTIRLVQRRRAVGNSGFWGNRWKHPRPGFEIRYRTLREYKPGVREATARYLSVGSPHVRSGSRSPTTPHVRLRQPFISDASTVFETLLRLPNPRQLVSAAVDLPSSWRHTTRHAYAYVQSACLPILTHVLTTSRSSIQLSLKGALGWIPTRKR